MINRQPLVSIILPTFNREKLIKKSIGSVLSQTYKNFELVIIDDFSTDNTPKILFQYQRDDQRIKVIRNEKNIGFVRSLNKGIKKAAGFYIARIDDDDFWCDKQKLEKQVNFLEGNLEYVLVGGGVIKIDERGKEIARFLFPKTDSKIRQMMLLSDPFVHSSILFKKKDWGVVNGYDENFDYSQDWDLWAKLGRLGKFYNFQEYFVHYLQGPQNRCNKNIKRHLLLSIKLRRKHRKDYPNFYKAYLVGWGAYFFSFLPFQKKLSPVFSKLRSFIIK